MHLRAKTVTRDVRAVLLGLCLVVGASVQAQQPNALRLPDPLTRAAAAAGLPVPATSVAIPEAATPAGRALPTAPPTDDPSASALDTARLSSQLQVAAAAQSVREAEAEAARAQRAQADALLRAEQAASEVARAVAAEQARIEAQRLALAQAQRALAKRQQEQGGAIVRSRPMRSSTRSSARSKRDATPSPRRSPRCAVSRASCRRLYPRRRC